MLQMLRAKPRFAWQVWHFVTFQHVASKFGLCALLHRFEKMSCTFRGKHNTLETSIAILLGRRTLWQVLRRVLFLRIAMSGLRQVQIALQASEIVSGADPSCVEYHSAWQGQYLGPSTLYTTLTTLYT